MREFFFDDGSMLVTGNTLDGINLTHYLLVVSSFWCRNFLWHITIIDCKLQIGASQQFLHTRLLVFHQGIKRIKENCLYLFGYIVVDKVLHQRQHEALGLTRTCACCHHDTHVLAIGSLILQQRSPTLELMFVGLVRHSLWQRLSPQRPQHLFCFRFMLWIDILIVVHTLYQRHSILGSEYFWYQLCQLIDVTLLAFVSCFTTPHGRQCFLYCRPVLSV